MSIKAMAWAWSVDLPPTEKYLLLALSDHANDEDFSCWPSLNHLQRKTGLSRPGVWKTIDRLVEAGAVVRSGRSGSGSTVYTVMVGNDVTLGNHVKQVSTLPRVGNVVNKVGNHVDKVGNDVTPNHKNHQEPSINHMSGSPPDVSALENKNGKRLNEQATEILSFLNEKTGRRYQPVRANLELILARLKEGYTTAQLHQIVAKKTREWMGDERMANYLRPATLFNRTKCAQYAGELGSTKGGSPT